MNQKSFDFPGVFYTMAALFFFYRRKVATIHGEMAEWFNATVLKTVVPQGTPSSNLGLSASNRSEFLVFRL